MARAGRELTGSSGDNEKPTPRYLFDWLNRRYRFDYDAAASHQNALCRTYSTVDGTYRRFARGNSRVHKQDGLTLPWDNRRVFVNPPYGAPLYGQFVDKMIQERDQAAIIVALVRWDTSTANARLLAEYADVTLLPRIRYEGEVNAATFASAIVVLRPSLPTDPRPRPTKAEREAFKAARLQPVP